MYIYPNKDRCSVVCLGCGRVSSQSTLPDWSDMRPIARRDMLYGFCVDCTTRTNGRHFSQSRCCQEKEVRERETVCA